MRQGELPRRAVVQVAVHADAPGALMDIPPEFYMKITRSLAAVALLVLATSAWAQSASKPLNLKLPPPSDMPPTDLPTSASSSAPASASSVAGNPAKDPPGTYYGDTSGRMPNRDSTVFDRPRCDDATYNQPQVHGSITTGVVSASRGGSGSYQAGTVNLSQAFGSCEHPTGGVSISVGTGTSNFGGRGR
jgi:hypothetical protein